MVEKPEVESWSGSLLQIYPANHPSLTWLRKFCAVLLHSYTPLCKKMFFLLKCKTHYPQRELCFTLQFAFKTFLMPLLWILKTINYLSSLLCCHYLLCVPPSKICRWLLPRWMVPKTLKKLTVWWQKHCGSSGICHSPCLKI